MKQIFVYWIGLTSATAALAQEKIPPQEASKYIGKNTEVQVEFYVQRTGGMKDRSVFFLNSGKAFRSPQNFMVAIPAEVANQLQKKGVVGSPDDYFRGRTVKATGIITTYKDNPSPQIQLKDASQLEWLEDSQPGDSSGSLFSSIYTYLVGGGILVLVLAVLIYKKKS